MAIIILVTALLLIVVHGQTSAGDSSMEQTLTQILSHFSGTLLIDYELT